MATTVYVYGTPPGLTSNNSETLGSRSHTSQAGELTLATHSTTMRIGPRSNSQRDDMTFPPWSLEQIPGVLPFEVYAQAPLRLISWCSFELDHRARTLVRELAVLCETPTTSIAALIERIQQRQANIQTEETAVQHLILCGCTATGTSVGRSCLLPSWGQRGSILGHTLDSVLVGETCGCSEPSPRAN